jgi:hypothetical protein
VLAFVSFLIATVFSVVAPIMYFGCDFSTTGFSSKSAFDRTSEYM